MAMKLNTKEGMYEPERMREDLIGQIPGGPLGGPTAPTEGNTPGPVETPNEGQTGTPPTSGAPNPRPVPPPPPPIASVVEGVEGSQETGGVRGSFGQAGTAGFQRRFGGGGPAEWYRRTLMQMNPSVAKAARERSGTRGGGVTAGGSVAGPPTPYDSAPGDGDVGGRPGDADMQRLLAEAMRRMFGRGGA